MSKYCYIVALGMSAGGMLCLFTEFEEGSILLLIGVLVGLVGAVASLFEKDVDALRISGVTVVLVTAGLTVAVLVFTEGWGQLLAIPIGLLSGLALEIVMIVSLIRRRQARAVARLRRIPEFRRSTIQYVHLSEGSRLVHELAHSSGLPICVGFQQKTFNSCSSSRSRPATLLR